MAAACSDDDKQDDTTKKDAALPDASVKDDVGGATGDGSPDGAAADLAPDQAVVDLAPDMPLKPDAPPASANWMSMTPRPSKKLYTVAGKSASEVYAGGAGGLLMKYNGSTWSSMTNPDTNKTKIDDIFINKDYVHAYGSQLRLYLSSGKWAKGYIPTYSSQYYNFIAVWGPSTSSTKFGVGDMGYYIAYKTSSSTSGSWSYSYLYSLKLTESLQGIWGTSVSNVYAVGDKGEIWHCGSSCTSYSGSGWKKLISPTKNNLQAIWGADSKNIFAVGLGGTILKYDGTSWKKMKTNTYTYFYGVWGTSAKDVWAVGHPIFKKDEAIFHYNGTSWTKVPPPGRPYLNDVWGYDKDNVFVVGNNEILRLKKHP